MNTQPAPTGTESAAQGGTMQADELARALGTQARSAAHADVYATLIVDYPPGRVALCVTDLAEGRLMAAAAKSADSGIELDRIDYYLSRYSKATLDRAADLLVASAPAGTLTDFPVYGFGPAQDYGGMLITTSAAGVDSAALRAELTRLLGDMPFILAPGAPAVPAVATAAGE
ncbi:hypothetical protein [Kitasatospora sp. SolWspMP-SS2h]|uniref:hypothetical protein n=1 Tax=Kitasatospora sp. SolWspMP-SS2h TaxID=1305729 RepID=UPI0011B93BF7|nr:hypothetical protein [Kitasatospora sp. SolWspMP-SS2h]